MMRTDPAVLFLIAIPYILLFILSFLRCIFFFVKTYFWQEVEAEVVDYSPKGKKFKKFFLFDGKESYIVTYKYYVQGNSYISKRVNFYDKFLETDFEFSLIGKEYLLLYKKLEDIYRFNGTIKIYYNPNHPEESVIIKKIPFLIITVLLINLILITIVIMNAIK